ncbi:DNA-binding NarL/FixJ family response regulator [Lacinutrix venerupis]|uniref:Response regulator n=2 Tax=Lacinutrix venerupis TaxID=1486034 RepID=A0AAC9PY26_9FLAO|nr:response regulator transcription factor [Lacinutrix venerupis]APY01448.1 response regulator [Lacinutrix venerupis]RLJ65676.1 DNA-binding NarL/FixJ family response regulator [Lacinutrix venerupis]
MAQEIIKILMTDDHPMIIEGYQNTLLATKKESQKLIIDIATNCDESLELINKSISLGEHYTVCFFDISMPPSSDGEFKSGEDLALYVRKKTRRTKIVMLTMFDESYRIHSIINNIDPEGFLIKSDITSRELASAFQAVLHNPPFYSGTVNQIIKRTRFSNLEVDEVNHHILYLISKSMKNKDIAKELNLSLSSIEKKKKLLKEIFKVEEGDEKTLIEKAKGYGFLNN